MVMQRKESTINRCACGKIFLKIQTKKKYSRAGLEPKLSKRSNVLKALGSLSRKQLSSNEDENSNGTHTTTMYSSSEDENKVRDSDDMKEEYCQSCGRVRMQSEVVDRTTQKEIPLLQRLKIVRATSSKCWNAPLKPLPQEVVFGIQENPGVPAAATAFSELAVDGIPSTFSVEVRAPTRFTFDGIVPSASSMEDTDPQTTGNDSHQNGFHSDSLTKVLDDLDHSNAMNGNARKEMYEYTHLSKHPTPERERCRTGSTEISIEYSASQHFRLCEKDKECIFSPRSNGDSNGEPLCQEKPEFPAATSKFNDEEIEKPIPSSWFSFGLW